MVYFLQFTPFTSIFSPFSHSFSLTSASFTSETLHHLLSLSLSVSLHRNCEPANSILDGVCANCFRQDPSSDSFPSFPTLKAQQTHYSTQQALQHAQLSAQLDKLPNGLDRLETLNTPNNTSSPPYLLNNLHQTL